jgi:hypothetical protein
MPNSPRGFQSMSELHLRQLSRLAERGSVGRLKRLYDQAQKDLERKIARATGRGLFTAQQMGVMLAQVQQGQIDISRQLAAALGESSRETQTDALRQLITRIKKMERKFTGIAAPIPIEEAARFAGIIDRNRSSLLKMHQTSMARYGMRTVVKMQDELAQSLIQGESNTDAIDRIQRTADLQWASAERIVRTEQAYVYNSTQSDAVAETKADLPDLMMRWVEHVSDTYSPRDNRVGDDSIAMHGQVAEPGSRFVMPPTTPSGKFISRSLVGKSWAHPPCRPNDRGVLQPWRPSWGIPGWIWQGGRRVYLHER